MLQVRNWLFSVLGSSVVVNCFRLSFVLIFVSTIIYALKVHLGIFKVLITFFIFVLGCLLAMWQPYFAEKTHVLTYGLLGYLSAKDLTQSKRTPALKSIILALSFVSLISASDEIFQRFLPYRVGEIRDFMTNVISGSLGIALLFTLKDF